MGKKRVPKAGPKGAGTRVTTTEPDTYTVRRKRKYSRPLEGRPPVGQNPTRIVASLPEADFQRLNALLETVQRDPHLWPFFLPATAKSIRKPKLPDIVRVVCRIGGHAAERWLDEAVRPLVDQWKLEDGDTELRQAVGRDAQRQLETGELLIAGSPAEFEEFVRELGREGWKRAGSVSTTPKLKAVVKEKTTEQQRKDGSAVLK